MVIEVNPKVSEWLLEQPWRGQFINNCIRENEDPSTILKLVLGWGEEFTIDRSFSWKRTPEGEDFWYELNDELEYKVKEEDWHYYRKKIKI